MPGLEINRNKSSKNTSLTMLRDAVDEALEEGGAVMSTVFQQVREEGKDMGLQEGKQIDVKEGEEKNKLRVARNCLMKGMDIRTIAEITELPVERIESLKTDVRQENTAQS